MTNDVNIKDITSGPIENTSKFIFQNDDNITYQNSFNEISKKSTSIEYNNTHTYAIGDIITLNNIILQNNTNITTPEPYNHTKWTALSPITNSIITGIPPSVNPTNNQNFIFTSSTKVVSIMYDINRTPHANFLTIPIQAQASGKVGALSTRTNTALIVNLFDFNLFRQFGTEGIGNGEFSYPRYTTVKEDGSIILVSDGDNNRIQVLDSSGNFLSKFGTNGTGNGQFNEPRGIAINQSTNKVYVADSDNNRVQILDLDVSNRYTLEYSGQFGPNLDVPEYSLVTPKGIAIHQETGSIYVTDANHEIQAFVGEGDFQSAFGVSGTGNGQFNDPTDIAINQITNKVYVVDSGNNRVQILDLDTTNYTLTYSDKFGTVGSGDGQFNHPQSISIDQKTGNVYVVDISNNRVQVFDEDGIFITKKENLTNPRGVTIDTISGLMYVVDSVKNNIQSFGLLSGTLSQVDPITITNSIRDKIVPLCMIDHSENTKITAIYGTNTMVHSQLADLVNDFFMVMPQIKKGINIIGNTTGLHLGLKTNGGNGIVFERNSTLDVYNPNITTFNDEALLTIYPILRNSTENGIPETTLVLNRYDDGSRMPASFSGIKATNHRIRVYPGKFYELQYGQEVYSTLDAAYSNRLSESFIPHPDSDMAIDLAILTVTGDAINTIDPTKVRITNTAFNGDLK